MSDELPTGWIETPLKEIAEARMGETILAKQLNPTGVPVYSAGAANEPWGFLEQPRKPLGRGTVVVSARGSIGFPKIPKAEKFASTQTTIALRFPNEHLSEFACLWLKTVDWTTLTKGGAIPMLTVGDINELVVPLAPPAEQQRIVAKLEKLLGKVDACQQRLAKIPVLLKRFRQSVLAAACSGRLTADWREENPDAESPEQMIRRIFEDRNKRYKATCDECLAAGTKPPKRPKNLARQIITRDDLPEVPEGWEIVCWDDLADWITYGFTRPMPHVAKGIPIITAKNVRDGFLDWSQPECTTKEAFAELSEKDKPRRNEILITKDGAIRGRSALVETDEPFCISQSVAVVRFGGITAHEPFLLLVVRSKFTENLIEAESMGTAIPHISITNFGRFPVPLPPLAEQQEIVRRVEGLFALADQIEARFQKARMQVDKLTPSLLARAFRGELVKQDPKDEPAEKLLRRIRGKQNGTSD